MSNENKSVELRSNDLTLDQANELASFSLNRSIYEFDFNLICEYFSNMERQGPGSSEVTLKALGFIDDLTDQSRIVDLGCGTGGQIMTLAGGAPWFTDERPDEINEFWMNSYSEIDTIPNEMELYFKYKEFYGYVFYIGKKI